MDNRSINLILSSGNENEKKIIKINKNSEYKLTSIEGIESSDIELNLTDNSQSDGKVVNSKRISNRSIDIEGEYIGSNTQIEREYLISFFNPRNSGTLKVGLVENEESIIREIDYELESFKIVQDNIYAPLGFKVSLVCPDPFFKDEFFTEKTIAVWEGGLKFPFKLGKNGISFKHKTNDEKKQGAVFKIVGHVDTPIEIEFEGPAKNPCITNTTTNEFIRVKRDLGENETLYINTAYGGKKVRIRSKKGDNNAFNYIDLNSTFFSLQPGDNIIKYSNEDVKLTEQNVTIKYKNRYLGI